MSLMNDVIDVSILEKCGMNGVSVVLFLHPFKIQVVSHIGSDFDYKLILQILIIS
jgi:hypothetical protein